MDMLFTSVTVEGVKCLVWHQNTSSNHLKKVTKKELKTKKDELGAANLETPILDTKLVNNNEYEYCDALIHSQHIDKWETAIRKQYTKCKLLERKVMGGKKITIRNEPDTTDHLIIHFYNSKGKFMVQPGMYEEDNLLSFLRLFSRLIPLPDNAEVSHKANSDHMDEGNKGHSSACTLMVKLPPVQEMKPMDSDNMEHNNCLSTSVANQMPQTNPEIICITCEAPVTQDDAIKCGICQEIRHRRCDFDLDDDATPPDNYVCDTCILAPTHKTPKSETKTPVTTLKTPEHEPIMTTPTVAPKTQKPSIDIDKKAGKPQVDVKTPRTEHMKTQLVVKLSEGNKQLNKPQQRLENDSPTNVATVNAKMLDDEREKQLKKKEKILEERESAIQNAEIKLSDQTRQMADLKSLVIQLEAKTKTVEEENGLLKHQLLAKSNTKCEEKSNEQNPEKTCHQDTQMILMTTIASLTQTMTALSLRVDYLAGKVDIKTREQGSKEGQHTVTGFENEAYNIPNNYLPHSLIFSNTKNTLNQQSKTPNVTTSKQTTSASTHSDPKRKTYDYSNQNSQAYKNSSSQRNIPMNSAKQAGNYQHANVTSKRQSNGTRIFWNSNIDSLNLKPEPPKETDSSYPNTERNTENGTDHNTDNTPRTETDDTANTKFVNNLVHLDDDGSEASKTNQYTDNTDLIDLTTILSEPNHRQSKLSENNSSFLGLTSPIRKGPDIAHH